MMATKPIPAHHELKPYSHAVAGHEGTLCDPDGEYFIKPCVQAEIDFYEAAHSAHPEFAKLMPGYYGTLQLADIKDVKSLDEAVGPETASHMSPEFKEEAVHMAMEMAAAEAAAEAAPEPEQDNVTWKPNKSRKIATNKSVVLENLAFGFKHPNILDAKLGKRLWADDAPLEKKVRFDDISARTTNGSHGFRIAGMRVYKGSADAEQLDQEDYMVYDKYYGRDTVNSGNIIDAMKSFIFNKHAGITKDLGRLVAGKFLEELKVVEKVLEAEGSRMYSASLLFTFEGCGETLLEAIEAAQQGPATEQAPNSAAATNGETPDGEIEFARPSRVDSGIEDAPQPPKIPDFSASRTDSGIVLDADDDKIVILETVQEETQVIVNGVDMDMGDVESFELLEMSEEEEEEESSAPRICSLKLIDFAHARFLPKKAGSGDGESGPDLNVLHGVKSLIKIFEELSTTDDVDGNLETVADAE